MLSVDLNSSKNVPHFFKNSSSSKFSFFCIINLNAITINAPNPLYINFTIVITHIIKSTTCIAFDNCVKYIPMEHVSKNSKNI